MAGRGVPGGFLLPPGPGYPLAGSVAWGTVICLLLCTQRVAVNTFYLVYFFSMAAATNDHRLGAHAAPFIITQLCGVGGLTGVSLGWDQGVRGLHSLLQTLGEGPFACSCQSLSEFRSWHV